MVLHWTGVKHKQENTELDNNQDISFPQHSKLQLQKCINNNPKEKANQGQYTTISPSATSPQNMTTTLVPNSMSR